MAIGTAQSYIQYGWEATYGSETGTYNKVFGSGQTATPTLRNNFTKISGVGDRNITTAVAGKFEGAARVECNMANPWWIKAVLGSTPADAGSTPYTHTYSESDTLTSFSIEIGNELGATDSVRSLLGCVVNSCTLSCAVGEPVKLSFDILYSDEAEDSTLDGTPATESFDTYFFQQGTLTIGSAVTAMQTVNLTINNNVELTYGIGSRTAVGAIPKKREYNLSFTAAYEDDDWLELAYGQAGSPIDDVVPVANASMTLVFTNGLASSNERTITITLANIYFDQESLPLRDNERLDEDIVAFAESCTSIVAEDNVATAL